MNTFLAPRFKLGWILILIALLNSIGWTAFRWSYENSQRRAQITVDYDDTRVMADAFGVEHEEFLQELQKRGVTSLGLYGQSIANFRDNGRISIFTREEAAGLFPDAPWGSYAPYYRYLIVAAPEEQALIEQIQERLLAQAPPGQEPQIVELTRAGEEHGSQGILIPASKQLFNDAQVGFDPVQIAFARKLGMSVTARLSNALNMDLPRARALLDDAVGAGAKVVIFAEDEVLGYNSMIGDVAREMQERGLLFGNIEFSKQRGWEAFSAKSNGELVRIHSVGPDEASKARPEVLTERFVRAVKERNIRVAYVRLIRHFKGEYQPSSESDDLELKKSALQQNYDYIEGIAEELQRQPLPIAALRPAMELGTAQEFGNYPLQQLNGSKTVQYAGLFLSSLGLVGGVLLLLNLFFDLKPQHQTRLLILGVSLAVFLLFLDYGSAAAKSGGEGFIFKLLGMWPTSFGIKLMAMVVGCIFSAIGILWGGLPEIWDRFGADKGRDQSAKTEAAPALPAIWWRGLIVLLKSSALMMIGSFIIIALLNQWRFFSGADKFFFPKLTQLVPLFIVGLAFAGEVFPHRTIAEDAASARRRAREWFNRLLDQPFTARVALLSGALAIAGFIWIARSGNDSGMEVSSLELKMRAFLEQVFITRPRTKEIFIGHPAFFFAVFFAYRRFWLPAFGATILATIGQADMLNTFCHLHTPLFYSFLRSVHAIWLGALIGGGALWLYNRKRKPS